MMMMMMMMMVVVVVVVMMMVMMMRRWNQKAWLHSVGGLVLTCHWQSWTSRPQMVNMTDPLGRVTQYPAPPGVILAAQNGVKPGQSGISWVTVG